MAHETRDKDGRLTQAEQAEEEKVRKKFNWRGNWVANSGDRWHNLKVIRNRHSVRASFIPPDKLTYHLVTVYMGAPSRQQTSFEGRNFNVLQTRGDVAIIPALSTMRSWYDEVEQDDIYLHLEPSFIKKVALEADLNPDKVELITTFGTRNPQVSQLAQLAFEELQRSEAVTGSNLYADSLANILAVQLLRDYSSYNLPPELTYANGLPHKKLSQVLDLINSALASDLSLAVLAQTAGLSQYHFLRLFKHSTGVTPHQYILRQRISRAKQLLVESDLSITEISYSLGFATPAHFTHHFRRQTGLTPSDLRHPA